MYQGFGLFLCLLLVMIYGMNIIHCTKTAQKLNFTSFLIWTSEHWQETVSILENLGISFLSNFLKKANEIYRSNKSEDDILEELKELDNEFYNDLNFEDTYEKVMKLFNYHENKFLQK